MPDFNTMNPPAEVTNPDAVKVPADREYPRHLYKAASAPAVGEPLEDGVIVVAWNGKKPIHNEIRVVADDKDQAKAIKDGFALKPVLGDKKDA